MEKMEGSGPVGQGDEDTIVNLLDAVESWSRLEPGVCEKILEKLPDMERLRLRVVCKDWNRSVLERVERKPFFVIIERRRNGLVVYDVVSKTLSFEQLPFKNNGASYRFNLARFRPRYRSNLARFVVEGLIFTNQPKAAGFDVEDLNGHEHNPGQDEWCVYNIHTRTMHVLPRAPGSGSKLRRYFCGMMVDTSIKPHPFKLVVSYSDGDESQIYDSRSRSWSLHPSNSNSNSALLHAEKDVGWYRCMCHKDCIYMSASRAEEGVLVYSMEEDRWSTLSGSPLGGVNRSDWGDCRDWGGWGADNIPYETQPYLGAWDDRIFAVLHNRDADSVIVWELIDPRKQKWVEYARCSKAQYEQLMFHDDHFTSMIRKCEIVSVFSEEYVLMYNWLDDESVALVLFNLKTKEWEPVAHSPIMFDESEQSEESDEDDYAYDYGYDYGDDEYGWSYC